MLRRQGRILNGEAFRRVLLDLETELRQRAPALAAALRPGLSEVRMAALLSRFPYPVPSLVETLYSWHDGADVVEGPYRGEIFPGGQMLPLDAGLAKGSQALEGDRRAHQSLWNPAWLPLFQDDQGRLHVISGGDNAGSILFIDFVELPDTVLEFSDLGAMAAALLRRWQAGAYQQGDHGDVVEDPRRVAALYREEDFAPVDIDRLLKDLADGSPGAYTQALVRMRTRLYPEAVSGLTRLLQGASHRGRLSAAELLGDIGDAVAVEALRRAAKHDPDPLVRAMAARSLKMLKPSTDR